MKWREGFFISGILGACVALLLVANPAQAFGPYETRYMAHLTLASKDSYEISYANDVQNHAFTFDSVAGELLTIESHWIAGGDSTNEPWVFVTEGLPSAGIGERYSFDYEAAIVYPNVMRPDNYIKEWEVPRTGTYTLHVNFYPYENGDYSLRLTRENAVPAPPAASGWTGEFPQIEGGDHYAEGTIDGDPAWAVHSFPANPGDMVTIMAWGWADSEDAPLGLAPRLSLVQGGYDPAASDALATDGGDYGLAILNYRVPDAVTPGTLFTAVVDGGTTTGGYGLWMRQWQSAALIDQIPGGITGELPRVESGDLRMDGTLSNLSAYNVHSFIANPGDVVSVTVTGKRDTPADDVIPLVLVVPGGYDLGEQWLVMTTAEDDIVATVTFSVPDFMPPNTLYTVVVADAFNADHLLFGGPPVFDYTGGYEVVVSIN